jgi:hypothetical protein
MITLAQAQEYISATLGATVPAFLVQAACDQVATTEQTMIDAGYPAFKQVLVQSMAVTLIACAGNPARIQSQGAPSGASRSFKHFDDALSALRKSLAHQDSAGTVANIIGPDPQNDAWFMASGA